MFLLPSILVSNQSMSFWSFIVFPFSLISRKQTVQRAQRTQLIYWDAFIYNSNIYAECG